MAAIPKRVNRPEEEHPHLVRQKRRMAIIACRDLAPTDQESNDTREWSSSEVLDRKRAKYASPIGVQFPVKVGSEILKARTDEAALNTMVRTCQWQL
jgi:hypothetical protein